MNIPQLVIPAFTTAQFWLDKNFYSNGYKLRGIKNPEDAPIVVDLGAFCGYFTFSALALGAKKVYAFEPFLDNYKVFLENTKEGGDRVVSYQLGVYTKDDILLLNYPEIKEGSYYDFADLDEGGVEKKNYLPCPVFSLDYILRLVTEYVDILKINLGYAEIDILLSATNLPLKVKNICLETKADTPQIEDFITKMKEKGYKDSFTQKNEDESTTLVIIGMDIKKYFNV